MDDLKELTHRLNEYEATILRMNQERALCLKRCKRIEMPQDSMELTRRQC